jgi:hypothetical protein
MQLKPRKPRMNASKGAKCERLFRIGFALWAIAREVKLSEYEVARELVARGAARMQQLMMPRHRKGKRNGT